MPRVRRDGRDGPSIAFGYAMGELSLYRHQFTHEELVALAEGFVAWRRGRTLLVSSLWSEWDRYAEALAQVATVCRG